MNRQTDRQRENERKEIRRTCGEKETQTKIKKLQTGSCDRNTC